MDRYKTTFLFLTMMTVIAFCRSAHADVSLVSVDAGTVPADGATSPPDAGADLGQSSMDDLEAEDQYYAGQKAEADRTQP